MKVNVVESVNSELFTADQAREAAVGHFESKAFQSLLKICDTIRQESGKGRDSTSCYLEWENLEYFKDKLGDLGYEVVVDDELSAAAESKVGIRISWM